ncbi:TPA: hypothetical protein ACS70J_000048 [Providencia alcalifaciens]
MELRPAAGILIGTSCSPYTITLSSYLHENAIYVIPSAKRFVNQHKHIRYVCMSCINCIAPFFLSRVQNTRKGTITQSRGIESLNTKN